MKNILFDIRTAQTYYGRGVYRYCFDLVRHLAKYQTQSCSVTLLIDKNISKVDLKACQKVNLRIVDIKDFDSQCINVIFDAWIIGTFIYFSVPNKWNSVDFLYPKNVQKKCKSVFAIIHDMIPVYYPEECLTTFERKINFALQFEALQLADHYLCNSQYTLETAQKLLKRPQKDFSCIYGSTDLDKWYNKSSDKEYVSSLRKNNIVYVCGDVERKNYIGLIKAFNMALKSKKLPSNSKLYLVCSGVLSGVNDYLRQEKLEDFVIATGFISDEEMLSLLSTAKATFFPSFYEGLGLPILESYAAGTPCFVANTTATKEFALQDTQYDPSNIKEISHSIIKVFTDERYCKNNLSYGIKLLTKMNWDNIALNVIKLIEGSKQ